MAEHAPVAGDQPVVVEERATTYSVFQTSIAKLQTTRWKFKMNWAPHSVDQARDLLRAAPIRDKRALSEKGIFRMLFVHLPDTNQLSLDESLVDAATGHGWADSQLSYRLRSKTGGMVWSHSRREDASSTGACFVAQTPVANDSPTYYLSLTEVAHSPSSHSNNAQSDWVCLFIGTREIGPERVAALVAEEQPFPSDFLPPLSPDFVFFPVCILSYDVAELARGVDELNNRILGQAANLTGTDLEEEEAEGEAAVAPGGCASDAARPLVYRKGSQMPELQRIRLSRSALLAIQQRHLTLKRRWAFLKDFAETLVAYFIARETSMSKEGDPAFYSPTLRKKVDRELANLASLSHELSSIPLRIEAQQTSVDNYTSLLIASNSQITAHQSLLESKAMRMVAVVTFVFLPGTFVAALFSMSMFNWDADQVAGEPVVSKYIWIYVLVTISLTSLAVLAGALWMRQKRHSPTDDIEIPNHALNMLARRS